MSYFSTEEVDNLKRLREMVTEDLINEIDYADAKDTKVGPLPTSAGAAARHEDGSDER